jgi:hypothetical protein
MTKTTPQAAAIVLSALMTLGIVTGMNAIASTQYAKAERLALASSPTQVVTLVGRHRVNA